MNKFEKLAATWDDKPSRIAMAKKFGEEISKAIELKSSYKLVDYGCGTGTCAIYLSQFVGNVIGIDSSKNMLERFSVKICEFNSEKFKLIEANLENEDINFNLPDVIISTMTFHHISDTKKVLKHFYNELKDGGYVAIIDLDKEDGTFHDLGNDGVKHFGFDRELFISNLKEIGFKNIKDKTIHEIHKNDKVYTIFLITGKK